MNVDVVLNRTLRAKVVVFSHEGIGCWVSSLKSEVDLDASLLSRGTFQPSAVAGVRPGGGMVPKELWIERAKAILADVGEGTASIGVQRSLIFGLWSLFVKAPNELRRHFEELRDAELERRAKSLAPALGGKGNHIRLDVEEDREVVQSAAVLLRALEISYCALDPLLRMPRTAADVAVTYRGEAGYLLPFKPRYRPPDKEWPRYFSRRGLRYLRCVPAVLTTTGHRINLAIKSEGPAATDLTCGACLFESLVHLDAEGVVFDPRKAGEFVFSKLQSDNRPEIQTAVATFFQAGNACDVIVFPELSMPPDSRAFLESQLRSKPWPDGDRLGKQPFIVIAGSWHEKGDDGKFRNIARVFDGDGLLLGVHAKNIAYTNRTIVEDRNEIVVEGIEESNEILVIATPTATFSVAICLDFCDVGRPNPFDELDVDLVLVVSLAGPTTMAGHRNRAEQIWNARKMGSFVVQQSEEPSCRFGFVLTRPDAPGESGATPPERVSKGVNVRKVSQQKS